MGFYLHSLLTSLIDKKEAINIEWIFLLNQRLPKIDQKDKVLLDSFNGSVIQAKFLYKSDCELFNDAAKTNRDKLDEILSPILHKNNRLKTVFLMPALFSSEIYPVFPSRDTVNLLIFYDIIPFLYHQYYFRDHEGIARKDYAQRFREFYKADLLLAISQTTADDLNVYFGVDHSRIVPILGAGANRSSLESKQPGIAVDLKNDFVLMPSGDDYRKNNNLAAKAFALLNNETKLVVTSNFSKESQRVLTQLCPKIIFSGVVSDEEYLWLVDNAKAVFFPTEYEGLGMPVLEAIERNAIVVCSNIPVFVEISRDAFFLCDPTSVCNMEETLKKALSKTSKDEITRKKRHYASILKDFSWSKTADIFLQAIFECMPSGTKPKLAIFCPSPSSYSAVGKYAFEVHAELSKLFDIDYYVENGQTNYSPTRPNILEYATNYYPATSFNLNKAKNYNHILYNIGNSEFHTETILNALRFSADAIIHDTKLIGIFDYMVNRNIMAPERRQYEILLDDAFHTKDTKRLVSLVTNQNTIFCHSRFAKDSICSTISSGTPSVQQIIHPIGVPFVEILKSNVPTISFAGIISEDKGISLVSEVSKIEGTKVNIFGYGVLGDSPLLQNIGPNVTVIKDLTDKEFQDTLRKSDILVNYRVNYQGETSRSTLEAMRYGVVVIVRKIGWFDELPDDVVVKVNSETEVVIFIQELINKPSLQDKISKAARKFLMNNYSYAHYAELIKRGIDRS
jgi:glycosyltransferase involved in cell wall biosynthesis